MEAVIDDNLRIKKTDLINCVTAIVSLVKASEFDLTHYDDNLELIRQAVRADLKSIDSYAKQALHLITLITEEKGKATSERSS